MKRVSVTIDQHVAIVKLDRAEKMNALDHEMFLAIIAAGEEVSANPSVRAVVLHGDGRAFCAGLDLMSMAESDGGEGAVEGLVERTYGIANKWQKVAYTWRECPVPVIAAVHGVAFGGGLQIMAGADIKYVAPDTKLSIMEMKWGLIPDMAGTQLWRHSVRDDIIRELTYTHRVFSGKEAVDYGFATHVSENPFEDAMKLAQEIASKSPTAVVKAKKVLNKAAYLSVEDGLQMESDEQNLIIKKKNQMEAVFAGMQKRPGNFDDFRE